MLKISTIKTNELDDKLEKDKACLLSIGK